MAQNETTVTETDLEANVVKAIRDWFSVETNTLSGLEKIIQDTVRELPLRPHRPMTYEERERWRMDYYAG